MKLREVVREKYGQAVLRVSSGGASRRGASATLEGCDPITSNFYESAQTGALPQAARLSAAETRPRLRSLSLAKRCWI